MQTEDGPVQGNVAIGVENILDIPYAAPPVGELRWSPPQPPAHWSDVRPAKEYGSYCPQLKTLDSANVVVDEDCLDVNIQRPIGTREDAKLPVYVYIHGGGYVTGSGNKDGQDRIVRTSPVVGVTLNYRLGALGFLTLPSLTGGGDFGFEDQQAALGWIKRNIAAFGGDPNDITIGGKSAGGRSVCAHLVAQGSRGLFNKAIIESGACDSKPAAQAEAEGAEFAHKLGCTDATSLVSCLREKPVADVLNAQAPYYLLTDGTPALPTHLWTAVNGGDYARVPIIIGSTRDEDRSFFQSSVGWTEAQYDDFVRRNFGPQADAVLKQYPWPNATDPAAVAYQIAAIGTDNGNLGAGAIERASAAARQRLWPRSSRRMVRSTSTSSAPAAAPAGIRLPAINGAQATPRTSPISTRCMTAASSPRASLRRKARSPTRWLAIGALLSFRASRRPQACQIGRAMPQARACSTSARAGRWNP